SVDAPGAATPTGTVSFSNGADCASVALSASAPYTATCTATYQAVGQQTVTASYTGDSNVLGSQDQVQVTVGKAPQALSFVAGTVPGSELYQGTFPPAATSDAGLTPVAITVSGACSIDSSSGVVTMTSGTGTCTVYADQAGNATYSPATEI